MIGRLYRWRGETWRVLARWRDGRGSPDQRSWVCDGCGRLLRPGMTIGFCRCGMGAACYVTWAGAVAEGVDERGSWHAAGPGEWARYQGRAPRNVLIERVEMRAVTIESGCDDLVGTGELVVRPFRGLRRA